MSWIITIKKKWKKGSRFIEKHKQQPRNSFKFTSKITKIMR